MSAAIVDHLVSDDPADKIDRSLIRAVERGQLRIVVTGPVAVREPYAVPCPHGSDCPTGSVMFAETDDEARALIALHYDEVRHHR